MTKLRTVREFLIISVILSNPAFTSGVFAFLGVWNERKISNWSVVLDVWYLHRVWCNDFSRLGRFSRPFFVVLTYFTNRYSNQRHWKSSSDKAWIRAIMKRLAVKAVCRCCSVINCVWYGGWIGDQRARFRACCET